MPTPIVKLSRITNLHDARFGAGVGTLVDMMLGFCVDEGAKNAISEQDFAQISAWVTGCKIVLELEGEKISEEAKKILSDTNYKIDYVQVSALPLLLEFEESGYKFPIIYKYKLLKESCLNAETSIQEDLMGLFKIDYFLIESEQNNMPKGRMNTLKSMTEKTSLILGFGITKENILQLFSEIHLKGIAFQGGEEKEIGMGGYTDFDEISDILEQLEEIE